jgi:hypothetical protein
MAAFKLRRIVMVKIKLLIITAAFAVFSIASITANAAPAKPTGFYLEGSLGISNTNLGLDDTDFAYNFGLGYKINPFISIEAGIIEDDYALYNIAIKGTLPFDNGLSLFGKAGVGLENDDTFTIDLEPVAYFAGGVGYNVTPRISIFVEESAVTTAIINHVPGRYFSLIGLNYTF